MREYNRDICRIWRELISKHSCTAGCALSLYHRRPSSNSECHYNYRLHLSSRLHLRYTLIKFLLFFSYKLLFSSILSEVLPLPSGYVHVSLFFILLKTVQCLSSHVLFLLCKRVCLVKSIRKTLLKRLCFWLTLDRCPFWISGGTLTILNEGFRESPQSLRANARIVS